MSIDSAQSTTLAAASGFRPLLPAFGLGLSVAASHGIGRFGYALLLPSMRAELGWTYLAASWMNTANALGYVVGALSGYLLLRAVSASRLFIVGLLLTAATIALTGTSSQFAWLFVMRLLSGVGTAWTFSCGGALVTHRYALDVHLRGYATGLFYGCAGIGMIVTAWVVPWVLQANPSAWQFAWILLGTAASILAAWPVLDCILRPPVQGPVDSAGVKLRGTRAAIAGYLLFAAAHTAFIFFVFAWLRSNAVGWRDAAMMWMLLGAGIFLSPFVWQRALQRWPAAMVLVNHPGFRGGLLV